MNGYPQLQETIDPEIMRSLDIPALDDASAIQVAITNTIRAVMYGHISDRKAGLALYGLQLAAMNLPKIQLTVFSGEEVAAADPKPVRPFWTGAGYDKHLLQRGRAMLKTLKEDEKPSNAAQFTQGFEAPAKSVGG
jgi:hypothetical protein